MAKPIGTLGTIDTLTVGGRVFTDLSTLIVLSAVIEGGSGNIRTTFRNSGAGSGYAVTNGKTLTIWALSLNIGVAVLTTSDLAYSDNDVGQATSTAFTNPVYYSGRASFTQSFGNTASAAGNYQFPIKWNIVATKYPGLETVNSTGGLGEIFGYEA